MYEWTNNVLNLHTRINENSSTGDVEIKQNRSNGKTQVVLASYDYWPSFLLHGILFCLQKGILPPNPGNFPRSNLRSRQDEPVLLSSIIYQSKKGIKEKLPLETEINPEFSHVLAVRSDNKVGYYPRSSNEGNLVYFREPQEKVLTFTLEDMPDFFQGIIEPMERNVRGTRASLQAVYGSFPWEFYGA